MDAQACVSGVTLPDNINALTFAAALVALRRVAPASSIVPEPIMLAQQAIMELTQVFQIRDATVDERHVSELMKVLSIKGSIDPLHVWRCGDAIILIDGHHRLEAYRRWNREAEVPVIFFKGSVDEAIRFAEEANGDHKLPITYEERANYAWKLVIHAEDLGKLSKAQLIARTTISKGTIDTMRKVARELGSRAREVPRWSQAHREWKHGRGDDDREFDFSWQEAEAMMIVDRLGAEFGKKLAKRPEITAKAFGHLLGRKTPEIAVMMLEEQGLQVTLHDQDGNEVGDVEDFEPQQQRDAIDVPF